jgi:hypothetical protein
VSALRDCLGKLNLFPAFAKPSGTTLRLGYYMSALRG